MAMRKATLSAIDSTGVRSQRASGGRNSDLGMEIDVGNAPAWLDS